MPKASFSWGAGEKGGLAVARRNGDRKAAARKLLNPKHSGHSWGTFEVDWPTASGNPRRQLIAAPAGVDLDRFQDGCWSEGDRQNPSLSEGRQAAQGPTLPAEITKID